MRKSLLRVSQLEDRVTPADLTTPLLSLNPFDGYSGNVGLVHADVDGDGRQDNVQFTADSDGRVIVRFADANHAVMDAVLPFGPEYQNGLNVAAGDLDGDGKAEVVVTAKVGGSGRVEVLRYGLPNRPILSSAGSFFGIEDTNFRGGASVAVGDFNADGTADIAIGAGEGGGPRVAVYERGSADWSNPEKVREDFFALPDTTFRGGVSLASADFDADGKADLAVGAGQGGAPRVVLLPGALVSAQDRTLGPVADFFANLDVRSRHGVLLEAVTQEGETAPSLFATVPTETSIPEFSVIPSWILYEAEALTTVPTSASPVGSPVTISEGVRGTEIFRQFSVLPLQQLVLDENGNVIPFDGENVANYTWTE